MHLGLLHLPDVGLDNFRNERQWCVKNEALKRAMLTSRLAHGGGI